MNFSTRQTEASKPDHARDQYGFSLGGPIKKNKTFFFVDYEGSARTIPSISTHIVPTDLERQGDFSNQQANFQPVFVVIRTAWQRAQFAISNVIDPGLIDPIGQKIINLYPEPTDPNAAPGTQFSRKLCLIRPPDGNSTLRLTTIFRTEATCRAVTAIFIATTASPPFSAMAIGDVRRWL